MTEDSTASDRWLLQLLRELSSSSSGIETGAGTPVNATFQTATSGQDGVLGVLLDLEAGSEKLRPESLKTVVSTGAEGVLFCNSRAILL